MMFRNRHQDGEASRRGITVLAAFLRWWKTQLLTFIPDSVKKWWRGQDRIVFVSLVGDTALFEHQSGEHLRELFSVTLASSDSLAPGETSRKLTLEVGGTYRLLFQVPEAKTLRREVTLPAAVEENLRQVIHFELDRLTPFNADQVHFVCRIKEKLSESRKVIVDIQLISQQELKLLLSRVTQLGVTPSAAIMGGEIVEQHADEASDLPANQARTSRNSRRLRLAASLTALILGLATIIVPIWQKRAAVVQMNLPLAEAKSVAMVTDAIRSQTEELVERYNRLPDAKWASYSLVVILDELSKLLPDDTFLAQLDYDGKTLQIQGETASADTLIQTLENSQLFKDVAYKAQLNKIQGTNSNRFHISATVEDGAIPKAEAHAQQVSATPDKQLPPAAQTVSPPPAAAQNRKS